MMIAGIARSKASAVSGGLGHMTQTGTPKSNAGYQGIQCVRGGGGGGLYGV